MGRGFAFASGLGLGLGAAHRRQPQHTARLEVGRAHLTNPALRHRVLVLAARGEHGER